MNRSGTALAGGLAVVISLATSAAAHAGGPPLANYLGRTRVYRLRAARLRIVAEWLGWFTRS